MHRPSPQSTRIIPDLQPARCKNARVSTEWFDFTRAEATLQLIGTTCPVATAKFDDANPSDITPPANSPDRDLTNGLFREMIECVHVAKHAIKMPFFGTVFSELLSFGSRSQALGRADRVATGFGMIAHGARDIILRRSFGCVGTGVVLERGERPRPVSRLGCLRCRVGPQSGR
jgi:hypothetical protein